LIDGPPDIISKLSKCGVNAVAGDQEDGNGDETIVDEDYLLENLGKMAEERNGADQRGMRSFLFLEEEQHKTISMEKKEELRD